MPFDSGGTCLTIDGKPAEMDSHADVVFALKN
jgi:hypothetical protein